jgi:hypothetical protein
MLTTIKAEQYDAILDYLAMLGMLVHMCIDSSYFCLLGSLARLNLGRSQTKAKAQYVFGQRGNRFLTRRELKVDLNGETKTRVR